MNLSWLECVKILQGDIFVPYFQRIKFSAASLGWLLYLNLILITVVSLVFIKHFPSINSVLEAIYQILILPSVWGLYVVLFGLACLPLIFIPYSKWPLLIIASCVFGTLAVTVFIDSYIYDIYNYHLNWFFIEAFLADEGGEFFDVSFKTYLLFSFVALVIALIELVFLWWVNKPLLMLRKPKFAGIASAILVIIVVLTANVMHSWAYAKNYSPITSIGAHIPFHFPMHSRSLADNSLLAGLADEDHHEAPVASNLHYPKAAMQCVKPQQPMNIITVVLESWRSDKLDAETTPNMYQLAENSLWFKNHHSSGTVTTRGIFALMYGLAPTYMDNVVANNGVGGPVFLNVLKDFDYEFGVYPSGDIDRIKLTDTSFLPVKNSVEHGVGNDTIEKDFDILKRMKGKIQQSEKPFYGFMFFNSTHYLYYHPEDFTKFTPAKKPSLVDFKQGKNPEPYINRYKNSIYFIDSLLGELVDELKRANKWDNTILVVTSDHAEEFADTAPSRYGHGSNYTKYQTQVPLIIHWPDKAAKVFDYRTASIDVLPTLLKEVFNCENPLSDFTSGQSLFDGSPRDVQLMASYYNYAFVTEQGSFIQNPVGLLESRDNEGKLAPELKISPKQAFMALQAMKAFYRSAD